MPWPLQEAIQHGLTILSWYENFAEKEIPPEPIWDDAQGVEEWFKVIRKRQRDEMRNPSTDDDDDDSPASKSDDGEGRTDNTMMGNEFADYFRE